VGPFLFEWDEAKVDHIALHRFTPEDVEEVFAEGCEIRRTRQGRYVAYGRTSGGRMTLVVFHRRVGSHIRVITAREMSEKERRQYRRG